jgi:prepilin-type N-terminal cleavage/methylation domain-containing protein
MSRADSKSPTNAFTLVELLIVIIVIAILAGIAIPKFINAGERSKEGALRADIKLVTNAVQEFYNDTGVWPATLTDIVASTAPANGLDSGGNAKSINASSYHGPYLVSLPLDSVSGVAFNYGTASPAVGQVWSSASGNDLDGNPFSGYNDSGGGGLIGADPGGSAGLGGSLGSPGVGTAN